MNARSRIGHACILASLVGTAAYAAGPAKLLEQIGAAVRPQVVMLTRDGRKILYTGSEPRSFRVCVKRERDSADMKVVADGAVTILHPGDCGFSSGRRIVAMPTALLAPDVRIVATFEKD